MKTEIRTSGAPAPIGPYNQAILTGAVNHMLFVSGQIALDPVTGEMVQSSIAEETHKVMKNIAAVLQSTEMDFSHVVKASIFIMNMADFSAINEVYGKYFTSAFPARETVQVAALPKGANVEISVIAVR